MNLQTLFKAYEFAKAAHEGQVRKTGEPYITHPVFVAEIARSLGGADEETIIACLLHDVVEDTKVTIGEIRDHFGRTVATLVEGVTKKEGESKVDAIARLNTLVTIPDERILIVKMARSA